jgi:hypothetical protein
MTSLHDDMGHQGRDKTLSLVKDRFVWYGMTRDVETWITKVVDEPCVEWISFKLFLLWLSVFF